MGAALLAVAAAGGAAAGVEIQQAGQVARAPAVGEPVVEGGLPEIQVGDGPLDERPLGGVGRDAGLAAVEADRGGAQIGSP
ncbi:MAG TPA: hypothetical protein VLA49_18715 [Anaerolineales bacterium]|nr:hypothetical protein [Anaerolineales bacterium]